MPLNQDWAYGLAPVYQIGGGAPVIKHYPLKQAVEGKTAYTTALFKGQVVGWADAGYVVAKATIAATPGQANILGVCAEYYANSNVDWVRPDNHIAIWDGAEHVFRIQCDAGADTNHDLHTFIQRNFPITHIDDGSTVSGQSLGEADFSGVVDTTHVLRCIGMDRRVKEPNVEGANPDILVRFNHGYLYTADSTIT